MSSPDIRIAIEALVVGLVVVATIMHYSFLPYVPLNHLATIIVIGVIVAQIAPVVGTPPVCMYDWYYPWIPHLAQLAAQVALMLHVFTCVLLRVPIRGSSSFRVPGVLAIVEGILIVSCLFFGMLSILYPVNHVAMTSLFTCATVLVPGLLAAFIPGEKGIKDHPTAAPTWNSPSRVIPVAALALTASIITVVVSDPDWMFVPRAPSTGTGSGAASASNLACDTVFPASDGIWKRTEVARLWWQILLPITSILLSRCNPGREEVVYNDDIEDYEDDDDIEDDNEDYEDEDEDSPSDTDNGEEEGVEGQRVEVGVSGGMGATPLEPGEASEEEDLRRVVSTLDDPHTVQ